MTEASDTVTGKDVVLVAIPLKSPRESTLEKRYDEEDVAESSSRQADSRKYADSIRRLGKKEKSSSLSPLVEPTKVRHIGKTASREVQSCSVKLSSRASKEVARKPKYQLRDMSSRSKDYHLNGLRQADASDLFLSNFNSTNSATARVEKNLRRSFRNGSPSSRDNLTSNQNPRRSRSQSTSMGVVSVRTRQSPTGNPRTRPLEQVDESSLLPDPIGELGTVPQSALRSSRVDNDSYPLLSIGSVAEVLLELERIEYEGLTYEQLSFLENHLFLDGLINDHYSDMRMDIDDMTYEELLALGEEMGTVSTALSEEALSKCLKKSKYIPASPIAVFSCSDEGDAKCSICQEEWAAGDEMGMLVCEHFYHAQCIHQWLQLKNWCPICKASVSPTP
ncbi:probable E3 ubiquitin-protein ligase RHG1A isoform X2 [Zingiber officinale]|uniref:probable E3 ubiquitin-protein ligase RHG1A isoform X2 n=1 Tax=Zingiber officinale TaxID=94328 RepID=UPI001C4AE06B|nr:probable E3 ubiquitin-protein ligase RHG1A isoform X2 [Zingiber officinale]